MMGLRHLRHLLAFAIGAAGALPDAAAYPAYSEDVALDLAAVATAVYCERGTLASWSCGRPCEQGFGSPQLVSNETTEAVAIVGRLNGECTVAFRGSHHKAQWDDDMASLHEQVPLPGCSFEGKECMVGGGYLRQYRSIRSQVLKGLAAIDCHPPARVTSTGHSLGGIIATLAAIDLSDAGYTLGKLYTFGQMKLGDRTFAQAITLKFRGLPFFRVTRKDDPAAYVPYPEELGLEWAHGGREIYYAGATWQGYRQCDEGIEGDPQCCNHKSRAVISRYMATCKASNRYCGHYLYLQPRLPFHMDSDYCDHSTTYTLV